MWPTLAGIRRDHMSERDSTSSAKCLGMLLLLLLACAAAGADAGAAAVVVVLVDAAGDHE